MPAQSSSKRLADDERPAKRSRVSRACDQCRTAREKCDGTQPTCETCSGFKRSCTYTAPPKKRGIQPGNLTPLPHPTSLTLIGYIRTLELALIWLFQNTECEALLNQKLAQEGNSSILFGRETRESNRLLKSWRKSTFCKDVDRVLSGEQISRDEVDVDIQPNEDDNSDAEADAIALPHPQPLQPTEENAISPTAHFASRTMSHPSHNPSGFFPEPNLLRPNLQSPTPLPSSSWRLLEIYFAYTHAWLPICEKHDVLRTTYLYPEHGLILSPADLPNSHDHAELWSALAVAAHQAKLDPEHNNILPDSERLYQITKSLIPSEVGQFNTGHVKALVNLAVVNMNNGKIDDAWLLIGSASRMLIIIERTSQSPTPRLSPLFAGCFLIDNFLSLQLKRKPYLQRSDIDTIGEDGLEEWQPWTTPIPSPLTATPRTPTFGLSSFNQLLDLADILATVESTRLDSPQYSPQQLSSSLERWKAMLPTKLGYIIDERKEVSMNPPALLLLATYIHVSFILQPCQAFIDRLLGFLEKYQEVLGVASMPPLVYCLLRDMQTRESYTNTVENGLRMRFDKVLLAGNAQAWHFNRGEGVPNNLYQRRQSLCQVPTPESIQIPSNASFHQSNNRPRSARQTHSTSLLEDLLPDMNPALSANRPIVGMPNMGLTPTEDNFQRHPLQQHRLSVSSSTVPHDLENFFDELASLDGTERLSNQPQFMQNLGFAPDANMADFLAAEFGQFMPGTSNTFLPQHDDYTHLDPAFFGAT